MNKYQKAVQKAFIEDEKKVIKDLKETYNRALRDIDDKIAQLMGRADSNMQYVVYQVEYQKALKSQVNGILDTMKAEQFEKVSDYLNTCYEDGFIGTMYDLHGQGIPLSFPLDQRAVVQAVKLDSKISEGLYSRLGEDVDTLKRKITSEVSRGISTERSYQDVAKSLSDYTRIGYNNATRIARTEGHRIQVQSSMDACLKAKEKGADVVKQWDATLDGATRESHQAVDGEIRDLDERFSNGLMYPGDPSGDASEVINCRCALLERAKWALDEDELDILKERAEFFGLDKSDSFDEFREKYLLLPDNADIIDIPHGLQDIHDFDQLKQYMKGTYDIDIDPSVEELNYTMVHDTLVGVEGVFKDYPELGDQVKAISTKDMGVMCCSGTDIYFNPQYYQDEDKFSKMCKESSLMGWWPANSTPSSIGAHETGHAVEMLLLNLSSYNYEWGKIIDWNEGTKSGAIVSQALKNVKKTPYGRGKRNAELMKAVSGYGATKKQECFAEAFADVAANGDSANPLSIEIKQLAKEAYNKLKGM